MPLAEELRYFAGHLDGRPIECADAQNGIEVLEILERASASLLSGREASFKGETKAAATAGVEAGAPAGVQAALPAEREYFAHESAVIDEGARIGKDTKIWHFSHVLAGSDIGRGCTIGQNVVIGPDVTVGANCKIQNNVSVYKGVTLEEGVFCGPSMVFTNVYNPRAEIRKMDEARPTLVKRGATIGANATIVCGTTIGRYAFIGAGAVVIDDVPDHALVVGNPAHQTGWVCQCGERLDNDMKCPACGSAVL
jgi:UDP-2-acetamido-3-amino-2,3-dideoxy-glucuronate N-acetyltransferase